MIDYVVDASAMVDVCLGHAVDPGLPRAVRGARLATPDVLDLDAAELVERLVRAGALAEPDADETLRDIRAAPLHRVAHRPLLERIWTLRGTASARGAAYLALAEILDVPLLTSDPRLARVAGQHVEVYDFSTGSDRI